MKPTILLRFYQQFLGGAFKGVNPWVLPNLKRTHEYANLPLCEQLSFYFLISFSFCNSFLWFLATFQRVFYYECMHTLFVIIIFVFFYVAFNFYLTSVKLVFGDGFSCNCLCSTLLAQFVLKFNPPIRIWLRLNEHVNVMTMEMCGK
jgi:hypothetical protein